MYIIALYRLALLPDNMLFMIKNIFKFTFWGNLRP